MYTIDTSVWVNSFDQREAGHAISRQVLTILGAQALPIIVPSLVLAETEPFGRSRTGPNAGSGFDCADTACPVIITSSH